jgi:FkbM family methyltransferase
MMSKALSRRVMLRRAAEIEIEAPLARALASYGAKPAGLPARLGRKLVKELFFLLHQRLGLTAPGWMTLSNGRRLRIDCANTAYIEHRRSALTEDCYEPEVTAIMDVLAPGLGSVHYIGTNWGYYAALLATNPGFRGHIQAFELNPASFRELRRLVTEGGFEDVVTCHPFGLSDDDASVRVSRERHSVLSRIVADGETRKGDSALVRRLDGLGLPPPDLIKLDVEGHEARVLAGAVDTLREAAPYVVLESWSVAADPQPVLEPLLLLERQGYRLHRLSLRGHRLEATPLAAADRPGIAGSLDLLAVPEARRAAFAAAFPD